MIKISAEKKRYWLKLEKDFLKSTQIKVIKNMPNGKEYVLFYLAIMLESIETIGHLKFSEFVPYNEEMLAAITDTNIDIVRNAVKLFEGLGLIQFLQDGTIFLPNVPEKTGKESESAERVRAFRERQTIKALHSNSDVTNCNDNKEKDKQRTENRENKDKYNITCQEILDNYNSICLQMPKASKLTETRKKTIKARLSEFSQEDIIKAFNCISRSPHHNGQNDRNWTADFDWIMTPRNLIKILEKADSGGYNLKNCNNSDSKKLTGLDYLRQKRLERQEGNGV